MKNLNKDILELSEKYKDYTAQNLSKLIKIKSLSLEEKEVQLELKRQMEEADFELPRGIGYEPLVVVSWLFHSAPALDKV